MDTATFYIILENRFYRHADEIYDVHLEKIFTKNEIEEIIENFNVGSHIINYFLIITDDVLLLSKYIFCINMDELKLICDIKEYDKRNIRINRDYFSDVREEVYPHISKIKEDEIISATTLWVKTIDYPYDD